MKGWASERVLFLAVVFVAPLIYLAWQACFDPRIEFLVPSANADWALHPHQGVLDMRGTPVSRDLVFRRSFSLREVPTRLILRYRAFTEATLELNGKRLDPPTPGSWKRSIQIDLSPGLRPGQNTLAVRVHNAGAVPALLVTSPASLRTATGWRVALDTTPEATSAAATPWTDAPKSYLFFRDAPSPLAQSVGRPLLNVLVGAWLAVLATLGAWTWWRRDSARAAAPAEEGHAVGASTGAASVVVLALSLAFQLTNAFNYPAERSFVDSRDHADYVQQTARSWHIPSARDGFQMYQPPAYYWVGAAVYRLAGGDAREDRALKAVQLMGSLAGFSLVLLSWLLARRFFADEGSRATATAFAACLPMLLYTSPTVSNETFAAAAAGLAFYALARRDAFASSRRVAVAGICCGLALLSKYSGLFVAVAGMLLLLRPRTSRIRWRPLAIFAVVVLLLSAWLYLRNLAEFGDAFIGNWDEGSGFHYEQDPGYRSLGFYAGFGRVFTEPIEHAPWLSFADGIYG